MDNACCVLFGVIKGSVWNEGIWGKRNSSSEKQLSSTMKLVHEMIKGLFGNKEFGRKKEIVDFHCLSLVKFVIEMIRKRTYIFEFYEK